MPRILRDSYSDSLFSTSRANEDRGEFLLDNTDYSSSSSPQWLRLYTTRLGVRIQYLPLVRCRLKVVKNHSYHEVGNLHRVGFPRILSELSTIFLNDTATTAINTLSLHDALPI